MELRPILGITMGDVCGCGPEVTIRALMRPETYDLCRPVIIGSAQIAERAMRLLDARELRLHPVGRISDAEFTFGCVDVFDLPLPVPVQEVPYGEVTTLGGEAAFCAVRTAIELAMKGELDGTVTGPLNKEALHLAGHAFSGHTEIFAHFTGAKDYAMMLADEDLRVVHVSTHVSLREACDRVKKERVYRCIHLAADACRDIGISEPRIAVAGLNPHAGEGGLFGREEIEQIQPAIELARKDGLCVDGPIPPDTVFSKAKGGLYDIVVAMYHDQGHIALKVGGFVLDKATGKWNSVQGINITLGLPIVRVSVDHGTAFDVAGKGIARSDSMENAISAAARLSAARSRPRK